MRDNRSVKLLHCGWLLVGVTSCNACVGIDSIDYEDPPGTSSSAASTATVGSDTGSSSESASSSASTTTNASTGVGGEGGAGDGGTGGAGGTGTGGSGGSGGAGGDGGAGGECSATDPRTDGFGGSTLDDKWTVLEGEEIGLVGYDVSGGLLSIESDESEWYNDGKAGPFIYQNVDDDFFVWSRVRTTSGTGGDPQPLYHGAGILLRDPQELPGTTETFIMISVGTGDVEGVCKIGASVDSEGDSPDNVVLTENATTCYADLVLCRIGGETTVFGRELPGGAWEGLDISGENPDDVFGSVLEVGPGVFSLAGGEHTIGEFDFVEFVPTCGRTCAELRDTLPN